MAVNVLHEAPRPTGGTTPGRAEALLAEARAARGRLDELWAACREWRAIDPSNPPDLGTAALICLRLDRAIDAVAAGQAV